MKLSTGVLRPLWRACYSAALLGRREASVVTLKPLGEARFDLKLCLSCVGLFDVQMEQLSTGRHIIMCVRNGRLKQASVW
jgi:hypothetical protein